MYERGQVTGVPEALFYLEAFGHALLGYSATNGFLVNAVAGVLLLFSLYLILAQWFSRKLALLGILLLASFPFSRSPSAALRLSTPS
jgi:4-amino-4-deoxy-L-arabinose transferase-like glycosyltransferase